MTDLGKELEGMVALVTGGGRERGQGASAGRIMASRGATVVLTDVLDDVGPKTAAAIDGAEYLHLDVTSEQQWDDVVADVVERHGRLDALVNNAGISHPSQLVNTDLETWQLTLDINQTGVFLGMRAAARAMIAAGNGGSIVNISSVAGMQGMFGSTAYGASKWAVRGMSKIAAKELGRHAIRVNSVHPGFIETDMLAEITDAQRAEMARSAPLRRLGVPEDIGNMAFYLASPAAAFITGQEFVVDGGYHG